MSTRIVATESAPAAIGPYSQGVIAGGLLFVSGQIPLDPLTGELVAGDIEAQTEQVLKNLTQALKAAGGTLDDVVRVDVYIRNMSDF